MEASAAHAARRGRPTCRPARWEQRLRLAVSRPSVLCAPRAEKGAAPLVPPSSPSSAKVKKRHSKKKGRRSEHKGKCKFGWAGESFQYKHRTCMGRLLDAVKNWRQVCTAGGGRLPLRSAARTRVVFRAILILRWTLEKRCTARRGLPEGVGADGMPGDHYEVGLAMRTRAAAAVDEPAGCCCRRSSASARRRTRARFGMSETDDIHQVCAPSERTSV